MKAGGPGPPDELELSVPVDVLELVARESDGGPGPEPAHPGEGAAALVALVVPGAPGLGEHPGEALAVEVDPLHAAWVEAGRQVVETRDGVDPGLEGGSSVAELYGG